MKAHIVLAHPEEKSFNGQLAALSQRKLEASNWKTTLSDLYANGFDPCEGPGHYSSLTHSDHFHAQTEQRAHAEAETTPEDVALECDRLLGSDLLIVHFPLWWFGMPAILKGWIDRVFVYGAVYRGKMRYDTGICRGKKMLACITTGASRESCSFNGREGDSRLHAWPLVFPFRYIGFDVVEPVIFHGVGGVSSLEEKNDGLSTTDRFLDRWGVTLDQLGDRKIMKFNQDSDFDENKMLVADAPVYSPFVSHQSHASWS